MDSLCALSATGMAEKIRRKEISPVELLQAHLQRLETWQPKLNAFVEWDTAKALQQAQAAEDLVMKNGALGRLHGVPVSVKSSVAVAGFRWETGCRLREGVVSDQDAPLVARLRNAGAVILGTTNVPEMLMAYETDNLLYGRTNSPWDLERTPGGSSGGEAAAIAAGLSAGGIGSDGGGSIRVPAHFSGICGLKPTPGRVPITGHFPPGEGPFTLLGVVGPMARTVADLQLLFEVISGPDPGDPFSAPIPVRKITEDDLKQTTIGFFEDDGLTPVTPETRAAVQQAAEALTRQGFRVKPFRPEGLERARQLWYTLFGPGIAHLLRGMYAGREADRSPLLAEFLEWMDAEPAFTLDTLLQTLTERDRLRAQFLAQMEDVPVFLCPVCAVPAFRHNEREWTIDGQTVRYLDAMRYSAWFNLLGNPGVAVPAGRSPEGLPIGVQVVARPHEEELALAVAATIERECGGFRPPPLA